jgi:hypothetical protein
MLENETKKWIRSPVDLGRGPVVLLFYDGYERRARREAIDRSANELRRAARYMWRYCLGKQLRTGFYTQFLNLVASLKNRGCDVHINNYRLADRYPQYPIGVAGYPSAIKHIPKNHPVIFGPGDFGMPDRFNQISQTYPSASLICFSGWIFEIYEKTNSGRIKDWFAGIDTDQWTLDKRTPKSIDCLIYDKIRWGRDKLIPGFYINFQAHLNKLGLTHTTLRYGEHSIRHYRECLRRSKSLVFLCEHETQGLAYQEAMSMDVPIFAWDQGVLCDQELMKFASKNLTVTSVPYFSNGCGVRFKKENYIESFETFWNNLNSFEPRKYVIENLSPVKSASLYLKTYFGE